MVRAFNQISYQGELLKEVSDRNIDWSEPLQSEFGGGGSS